MDTSKESRAEKIIAGIAEKAKEFVATGQEDFLKQTFRSAKKQRQFILEFRQTKVTDKPKCIIVTGRAGAGKTTLAKKLGERLWLPVVSRDEIKQGYVNTFGVKHDRLPPETNGLVTDFFFETVNRFLANKISVVIEAAFQHEVWEARMPLILKRGLPIIVLCSVDERLAAERHLERGLENPEREFYHGDNRVVHYRKTGEFLLPAAYDAPRLEVPTIKVSTDGEYFPSIDEIVNRIQSES